MLQIIQFTEEIYKCSPRKDFLSNYGKNDVLRNFFLNKRNWRYCRKIMLLSMQDVCLSNLIQPTARYLYYAFIIYTIKRYVKRKVNIFYIYKKPIFFRRYPASINHHHLLIHRLVYKLYYQFVF